MLSLLGPGEGAWELLHWVSFPLKKQQATGYRPRQREEAADAHPILALTWSEDTQIQKLFFIYISKLRTKYLV